MSKRHFSLKFGISLYNCPSGTQLEILSILRGIIDFSIFFDIFGFLPMVKYILPLVKYILPMVKYILPLVKYILPLVKYILPLAGETAGMFKSVSFESMAPAGAIDSNAKFLFSANTICFDNFF